MNALISPISPSFGRSPWPKSIIEPPSTNLQEEEEQQDEIKDEDEDEEELNE